MTDDTSNFLNVTPTTKHKKSLPDIYYELLSFQQQH